MTVLDSLTTNMHKNGVHASDRRMYARCVLYIAVTMLGHVAIHSHQSSQRTSQEQALSKTQEDDGQVPTMPLQAGIPGLYIENGRADAEI